MIALDPNPDNEFVRQHVESIDAGNAAATDPSLVTLPAVIPTEAPDE